MTNEELVKLYQEGNREALEQLLLINDGLVKKVSIKFHLNMTASIDYDDLLQEGRIGLMEAAKKYKFSIDNRAKFSTYAVYWIYQKMHRFIQQKNTNEEISLNIKASDGKSELGDMLISEDEEFCTVEDSIYHQELSKEINQAMDECLTLRQRQVIYFRYGFNCKVCSLQEVGEILDITSERARQIEMASLRKLRVSRWGRKKHNEYIEEKGRKATKVTSKDIEIETELEHEEYNQMLSNYKRRIDVFGGMDAYLNQFI